MTTRRDANERVKLVPLADIDSGGRHRKDMGDLDTLVQSIGEVGLLQPVAITAGGKLIAGLRRLHAAALLGWRTIPAYVVGGLGDALDLLKAENAENVCRKAFTPSEAVAVGRALEELERAKAKGRQKERKGNQPGAKSGKLPDLGQARDRVAGAVGMSGRTFQKAQAVVQAAEADPDTFGDLPELMDTTGKVHQAFQQVKRRQKRQELRAKAEAAPPPGGDSWKIITGDCHAEMSGLLDAGERFPLVVTDPQYNEGIDYGDGEKADRRPEPEYLEWLRVRLDLASRLLTPDGSLWVVIDTDHSADVKVMLQGSGLHLRRLVTWYETFGTNCPNNFNRCSRHLLYFVKDPGHFTFNADAVTRPSDRQVKYHDKRADPSGKIWDDVWGIDPPIPRLTDTCAERIPGFPTQLPLALLRPIIGCSSDPGDLVLDPFAGSCTAGAAALEAGRRFVGIERQARFVELASERLRRANATGDR